MIVVLCLFNIFYILSSLFEGEDRFLESKLHVSIAGPVLPTTNSRQKQRLTVSYKVVSAMAIGPLVNSHTHKSGPGHSNIMPCDISHN